MKKPRTATLIRGGSYVLRNKRFIPDVPVEITEEEYAILKEEAIDDLSSADPDSGQIEKVIKQKFRFSPSGKAKGEDEEDENSEGEGEGDEGEGEEDAPPARVTVKKKAARTR